MDTGRCRIAPPPGLGEELKLRWFTGDWLLVQGNGEILSDDFAQLINRNTREVLRIRPGMFGGEKCSTLEYSPMARWSSLPGGIRSGRCFVIPSTSGGFLRTANKAQKLEPWREYKKCTRICPSFYRPRPRSEKSLSKDSPDHSGGQCLHRRLPFAACGKAGARPHCPAKWNTEKVP